MANARGFPGAKAPDSPTKFVVKRGPAFDGQTVPVCSYVTNANGPQVGYGLLVGAAVIVAAAFNPQGPSYSAEYQFGTHAAQLYNAEAAKTQVWKSVQTPPLLTGKLGNYVSAVAPDLTQPIAQVWSSVRTPPAPTTGVLGSYISAVAPDLTQPIAQVYPSVRTPVAATTGLLGKYVSIGQSDPDQIGAWSLEAAPGAFGPVPAYITISQTDPAQIAAQVWKSVQASQVTTGFLGKQVWASQEQSQFLWNQQSQVSQSVRAGPGILGKYVYAQIPLAYDFNQAAQVTASSPAPIVIINGPTVRPNDTVQPQWDFSINATVIMTPSTFSPSAPSTAGQAIYPIAMFPIGMGWR